MPGTNTSAASAPLPVVLVVDDEDAVRDVVRAALHRYGFEVWQAGDGSEAIELYRGHADVISIVLLDVRMPNLDGPAVLSAFRLRDPTVPAFFMTGDPGEYGVDDLLAAGAVDVFAKPLDLAAVAAAFHHILALGPGERAAAVTAPVFAPPESVPTPAPEAAGPGTGS